MDPQTTAPAPDLNAELQKALLEQQRVSQMLIQKDLQLTDANDRLERQILQLKVLQQLSLNTRNVTEKEAMDLVTRSLVQDLQFGAAFVFLAPVPLRLSSECSYKPVDGENVGRYLAVMEELQMGSALKVPDISKAPQALQELGGMLQLTSYGIYPLFFQQQVHGHFICGLNDPYQKLSAGDLEFLQIVAHSLSVYLESAEAIERQKRLDSMKSEFVSIVSHQLRTPLSGVKWILNMAQGGDLGELTEEQKGFFQKAYESNERMIKLVNDLLNISRIEEGHMVYHFAPLDLKKLVEDIITDYQVTTTAKRLKVETNFAQLQPIFMQGDQELLSIALTNLIDNAIKFSPQGGTLTIELQPDEKGVTFLVKDRGIGMSVEDRDKLFTKFFRAENAKRMQTEGTGLGLFISKNVVEKHRGIISVDSTLGTGTTFHCHFPL
jgi:signal transduction histidine kinase